MQLSAAAIARIVAGRVVGDASAVTDHFSNDSRRLEDRACFVALRDRRDGHDFVGDALASKATVAIVEHDVAVSLGDGQALVVVGDTLAALAELASAVRSQLDEAEVVGITGSVGKTSTKDLVARALGRARLVHAAADSYNNEVGLPLTILGAPLGTEVLVAEMGARRDGDIAHLASIAQPTIGIITNIGTAHAETLGGPEGIAAEKGTLVERLPAGGFAVLNADDPWTRRLSERSSAPVVLVGRDPAAEIRLREVSLDEQLHPSIRVTTPAGEVRARVGLRGEHQGENALFAIAVALRLGTAVDDVEAGLETARASAMRMNLLSAPRGVVVLDDSYNANPASMEAALSALARLEPTGRRVAILGDMRELGAGADEAHLRIGALAAHGGVEYLVGVGEGGALIAEGASSIDHVETFPDADAVCDRLDSLVGPGDAVLVKASRAVGLDRVARRLVGGGALRAGEVGSAP